MGIEFATLSRIVNLSAFMLECAEEGEGGNTDAITMMAVGHGSRSEQIRCARLVKEQFLDKASPTPLGDAAILFADHLRVQELLPVDLALTHEQIRRACAPLERPFEAVAAGDIQRRRRRSIARGIRFIWQHSTGAVPGDSRVFEMFVADALVPRGRSFADLTAGRHREHVVPCLWLYMHCRNRLEEAAWNLPSPTPPSELAAELLDDVERLLVIVELSPEQAKQLDSGHQVLKTEMPADWSPQTGCAFARLHSREILFSMLPESLARFPGMKCVCEGATKSPN